MKSKRSSAALTIEWCLFAGEILLIVTLVLLQFLPGAPGSSAIAQLQVSRSPFSPTGALLVFLAAWTVLLLVLESVTLHRIRFRYLALWGARYAGFGWRWFAAFCRLIVPWFGIVCLVALILVSNLSPSSSGGTAAKSNAHSTPQRNKLTAKEEAVITLYSALGAYILFGLLWWAWQARKRVLVEEFTDFTEEKPQPATKGIASLLANHLARAGELYRTIDDQQLVIASGVSLQQRDASIRTEDPTDILRNAVSGNTTVSIGFLQIPVGTILALFGRMVQSPRITGGLYREGDHSILVAQLVGHRRNLSWRVDEATPFVEAADNSPRSLDNMVAELACRIFTDLSLISSVQWRATQYFNEGLRLYRACLRTPKERKLKLRRAERMFMKTLAEDERFHWTYYNLGLIYLGLGQREAAQVSFRKALDAQDHRQWEPYYALAQIFFEQEMEKDQEERNFRLIQGLCYRVIALKPFTAKGYRLLGLAQRASHDFEAAIRSGEISVANSWTDLCSEYWRRRTMEPENNRVPQRRAAARDSLRELALTYLCKARQTLIQHCRSGGSAVVPPRQLSACLNKAEALLTQACSLVRSSDAQLFFELGKLHHLRARMRPQSARRREYTLASQAYRSALRIDGTQAVYWVCLWLLFIHVQNDNFTSSEIFEIMPDEIEADKQLFWDRFLERVCSASKTSLDQTAQFFRDLDRLEPSEMKEPQDGPDPATIFERLGRRNALYAYVRAQIKKGQPGIQNLEESCKRLMDTEDAWEYGVVAYGLNRLCRDVESASSQAGQQQIDPLNQAIQKLQVEIERCENAGSATYMGLERGWEQAQLLLIQGRLYLEQYAMLGYRSTGPAPESAAKCFDRAIGLLERKYPLQIRLQGLRALLAEARAAHADQTSLDASERMEALYAAEQAVWIDPLSGYERSVLGQVYESFQEMERARMSWEDALAWEPDEPAYHLKVGNAYLKLGLETKSHHERCLAFERAQDYFNQALELYESGQCHLKGQTHYGFGRLHFEMNRYEQAIPHIRIALGFGYAPYTSRFWLGWTYLRAKMYNECEHQLRTLVEQIEQMVSRDSRLNYIEEPEFQNFCLGEILILSYAGLALAFIERDAPDACEVQDCLAKANNQTVLAQLNPAAQQQCLRVLKDSQGWMHFKKGELDEAIMCLKETANLGAYPNVHYHLAMAYERKLQSSGSQKEARQLRLLAYQQCQIVRDIDMRREFISAIEALETRLGIKQDTGVIAVTHRARQHVAASSNGADHQSRTDLSIA